MNIKRILYLALAALCLGGAIAYYMWNKPHAKVEDTKGLAISAADLCAAFTTDESAANTKYLNKALDVNGTVAEVVNNQDGGVVVVLRGNTDGNILCTMRDKTVKAVAGQNITVKGFCSGYILTDVTITDCVIQ